jgi:hypothetical protein
MFDFFARLRGFTVTSHQTEKSRPGGNTSDSQVRVVFDLVPLAPTLRSVTFTRGTTFMAAVKGLTHFDTPADAGVTRKIQVTLNSDPAVEIDVTDPTVEFDCNESDTYSITSTDTNASGPSAPSAALTGTVPSFPPPPPPVPNPPPLSSVSFRLA